PDLVVSNIKVSPSDDCNSTIIATIENKGILNATDFFVKLNITDESEHEVRVKDTLCQNSWKNITLGNLEPNRAYNVRVIVDARGTVKELNEQNNIRDVTLGPDLDISEIKFYSENGVEIDPDKLILGENHTISVLIRNDGAVSAKDFKLKIWINASDIIIQEFEDEITDCVLPYGGEIMKNFTWKPNKKGWFVLNAAVDSENNVEEMCGEMEGESNNDMTKEVKVGEPGYKAKENPLETVSGEGNIEYIVDVELKRLTKGDSDANITAHFGDPVGNATLKFIWLYVYPDTAYYEDAKGHWMAFLPNETQLEVTFNGHPLNLRRPTSFTPEPNDPDQPADIPDATSFNVSYATYCYDVPVEYYKRGEDNYATAYRKNLPEGYKYGIGGIALLVVYDDKDAPLTKYWISEADRDVIMAKNKEHPIEFEFDDCTREIIFNDVKDAQWANATLKTVLVSYATRSVDKLYPDAQGEADALYFNSMDNELDIPLEGTGHWHKISDDIAITNRNDGWEYVNVVEDTNRAWIQSRGAMFCVAHAFLKVTYPPNLEPSLEKVPAKVAIGNSYDIPVVIKNEGKSAARNFNVTFRASDGYPREAKKSVNVVEGESTKTIYFRWTAPKKIGIVKINVTVDSDNDVDELINSHVNGEKDNYDEATITVVPSELEIRPPTGGRGGGGGMGIGTGSEAGTQGGAFGGMSAGAGREGASKGKKKAGNESVRMEEAKKTLWGYLMNNIILPGEEEAGGSSGFSLWEYLIKVSAFLIGVAFLVLGYLFERGRHNAAKHVRKERKSRGESER
ncbi:hypothetical protein DRO21_07120, partial [archaeon]